MLEDEIRPIVDEAVVELHTIVDLTNLVMPSALDGDVRAVRVFVSSCFQASESVSDPLRRHFQEAIHLPRVLPQLLEVEIPQLPLMVRSMNGAGVIRAMTDRALWIAGTGYPLEPPRISDVPFEAWQRFSREALRAMSILGYSSPLEPTMAIMYLKNIDVARIMDVSHQVISKWLSVGVPVERAERIVTMDEIATILHHRLREGYVPTVVRRPAPGFDGKTFLELFVEGREQDVLDSVRASFDYASIA